MKHIFQTQKTLFLLLGLLSISIVLLYIKFDSTKNDILNSVESMELNNIKKLSQYIDTSLVFNVSSKSDLYDLLASDSSLRDRMDRLLSSYIDNKTKYVYLVRNDNNGFFRYLLDGSTGKQKGQFNQRFIPLNRAIWVKCCKTKQDIYIKQKNVYGLWVTYLHPLFINHKLQGILAIDVSLTAHKKLESLILPLKRYFIYIMVFIVFVILVTAIQLSMFLKQRNINRIDYLTRLYNRSFLREKEKSINLNTISVVMADIDHFKAVNDTYGHSVGDAVLRGVSKRLLSGTRDKDYVIRYGGEEFLILLKKESNKISEVVGVVERLREDIANKPIRVGKHSLDITISIGLDPYTHKRESLMDSISVADEMLYKAKNNGRNRVEVAKG